MARAVEAFAGNKNALRKVQTVDVNMGIHAQVRNRIALVSDVVLRL